jgi:GNAT superfamily N-acetyltransferase
MTTDPMSAIEIRRMTPATRDDFYRVHCDANGTGLCNCVAWWVPTWDGWDERTAGQNRVLRDALFDGGEYDGYLLYVDGEPAGWAQVGRRDRLEKIVRQFDLPPDPGTWAITCFTIIPTYRRRGLARRLLRAILDDLRTDGNGIGRVEAYPRRGADLEPEEMWTGPESIYLAEGFTITHADTRRLVVGIELAPDAHHTP